MLAMQRAVAGLSLRPDVVLIDGNRMPKLSIAARTIIKGDAKIRCISAASILAKVARDEAMLVYHEQFPNYGFAENKGYLTEFHLATLKEFGPCPVHRKNYAPVRALLEGADPRAINLELLMADEIPPALTERENSGHRIESGITGAACRFDESCIRSFADRRTSGLRASPVRSGGAFNRRKHRAHQLGRPLDHQYGGDSLATQPLRHRVSYQPGHPGRDELCRFVQDQSGDQNPDKYPGVRLFHTNLVAAYRTNFQTLHLTNWTTVLAFRTNWVTKPLTNMVEIEMERSPVQQARPSLLHPRKRNP